MMNLGPEDDFFTESESTTEVKRRADKDSVSSHMVAARGQKLRVVLNGFPQ